MIKLCEDCTEVNKHFQGKAVYFPKSKNNSIKKSHVLKLLNKGMTMTQIAVKLNSNMNTRPIYEVFR